MQGFVRQRKVTKEKGDPTCRHEWVAKKAKCPRCATRTGCSHRWERCARCPAWRQEVGGLTAYWTTTDPATGKRRQHTKAGFKTKRSANAHRNVVVGKVQEGSWRPDQALTVKQLLMSHWLPAQRSRGRKPATLAQYTNVAEAWIIPRLGAVRVASLNEAQVVQFVDQLRSETSSRGRKGLSARSAQLAVGVLKAACAYGAANGLLGRNPIAGVHRPGGEAPEMRFWTPEQAQKFLRFTAEDRLAAAWALLLTRGLRRGELCGLRWEHVDLDAKRLTIAEARIVVDGKVVRSTTKTGKTRTVPLDDHLVKVLKAHLTQQKTERLAAGKAYENGGWVVVDEMGRPYHPDSVSTFFERAEKAAGLPRIRLHDCRHTAATAMLAAGEQSRTVADILGHRSTRMVFEVYGHILPGTTEQAGERLSALFFGD